MLNLADDERFRAVIEHSLDAVALINADGTLEYVTPSVVRILGYTPEEFLRTGAFEAIHPDDRDRAAGRFAELLAHSGGSQTALNRVRHKNGSWRWIETVSTNQLENPSVGAIVSNFRDVTDRRRLEEALRDREENFRMIVASAVDFAIFTLDGDGRIQSWNSGAERILGYSEDEILGQHVGVIFTPEDNAAGRIEFEMQGAAYWGHENDDRWHVKKGGVRFWANGRMMPLKDEAGELKGYLKILRDRTEQKLADDALKDADRRKDEFLAMLAHELRNPLAAINNAVQVLRRGSQDDDREWSKDVIDRQGKHLARLMDDLLDVSRITRGNIQLRKEWIDLGPIIARAIESVRPLIDAKKHTLTVSIAPGPMGLFADPTRMEQILVNLLSNAAKYTDERGQIMLTAQCNGDFIVAVKDNGAGIPREVLPHIFDLFAQGDRTIDRSQGGLGIGLTLVKRLVEMHGGTVTAASDGPGTGSAFTVRLPAVAGPTGDEATPGSRPPVRNPGGLSVLVVDDNKDTADGMARLLVSSGYRVTMAHDGPSALAAARAGRPDAILMDIGLPGMDGYAVAEQFRKDQNDGETILIAISGYGQEHDRRRSREAGFDHHLVKPVDYERLLAHLTWPNTRSHVSEDDSRNR